MKCIIRLSLSDSLRLKCLKCRSLSCRRSLSLSAVADFINKCLLKILKSFKVTESSQSLKASKPNVKDLKNLKNVTAVNAVNAVNAVCVNRDFSAVSSVFSVQSPKCVSKYVSVVFVNSELLVVLEVLNDYNGVRALLLRSGDIESNPGPPFQVHQARQPPAHHAPAPALAHAHAPAPVQPDVQRGDSNNHGHIPAGKKRKSDLQVMSYNIRGLNDRKKVRHIVNNCYKLTKDAVNSFFMFQEVKAMFQQSNLIDAWEIASSKKYTWRTHRTGQEVSSILDRIVFWPNGLRLMEISTDWSLSLSDHAAVTALFQVGDQPRRSGTQIARLDPRLLLDPDGREILDASFRELIVQASPDWNPNVRLEYFKMSLRTSANEANGKLKARMRDTELDLNNDINNIVEELSNVNVLHDRKILLMTKLDDLRQLKRALVEKVGTILEQRTVRKWYNEGELSNKYFFNLLNRKSNDEINAIVDDNGTEIRDPKAIEELITKFYKDLYESVPEQVETNDEFFRNVRPVEQNEADEMVAPLTLEELTATLKTCSDSAPGPDGIPYSYLKHFWDELGPVLLSSWQYSLANKELPNSHQVSYLRLIPKAGKDPRIISNLRPITLSNTDHKLITKTYARKLTGIIGNVVGGEQTAYIPGRLINDNIRAMLTTVDLANLDETVDGVLVSLDAKKAFDSVDHRYIKDCLRAFGLARLVPIFEVLYKNLKSQIIINGKTVDGYKILKGVKQGDALSCVLFILCVEPLIRNLKSNENINRIESNLLPITIPKVYGFADDISVAAKNNDPGVQAIFTEYELFTKVSGLQLNADKTELLCFNRARCLHQQF